MDVVGSTALKSHDRSDFSDWAHAFRDFLNEFPVAVRQAYKDAAERSASNAVEPLKVWKFLGDEVLFETTLTDHREVIQHLLAIKAAAAEYPIEWQAKTTFRLKTTAWIAGFPVTNTKILLKDGRDEDYIGPSMDLGFRIAKFATPKQFVISADLAVMLLEAIKSHEKIASKSKPLFHIFLGGMHSLKGVQGGAPYPIVWIDMADGQDRVEEQLLGLHRKHKPKKLKQFLVRFIKGASPFLRMPFIDGDGSKTFGQIPEDLNRKRKALRVQASQAIGETSANDGDRDQPGEPLPPPDVMDEPE